MHLTRAAVAASGGRGLLHFDHKDDHHDGGGGGQSGQCECKHADWYSYGYCSIGTTSGDVKGCQQAYLTCCGWAKVHLVCLSDLNTQVAWWVNVTTGMSAAPARALSAASRPISLFDLRQPCKFGLFKFFPFVQASGYSPSPTPKPTPQPTPQPTQAAAANNNNNNVNNNGNAPTNVATDGDNAGDALLSRPLPAHAKPIHQHAFCRDAAAADSETFWMLIC